MKNFTVFFILIFFGVSTSVDAEVVPEKCPSVSAIQSTHFWIEKEPGDTGFYAIQENQKYDTTFTWTFILWTIEGTSIDEVTKKVNNALNTLQFQQGPTKEGDGWRCIYNVSSGYKADANTSY